MVSGWLLDADDWWYPGTGKTHLIFSQWSISKCALKTGLRIFLVATSKIHFTARSSYHKLLYNGNRLSTSAVVVSEESNKRWLFYYKCLSYWSRGLSFMVKVSEKKLQVCIYRRNSWSISHT